MQFQKIRNFSVWQQALVIGSIAAMGQLSIFWAEHLFSERPLNYRLFCSVLSSTLLWPWVFLTLRRVRRHFHIR